MSPGDDMRLRDITMDDLPMYLRTSVDPEMRAELGGPLPEAGIEDKLRGIVRDVEAGRTWYFVITVRDPERPPGEPEETPAGTVCIWEHDDFGETASEMGWMVFPEFQGRGVATEAVRRVLDRARAEGRWGTIHALPAVTNAASNAICRKAGFTLAGERAVTRFGRTARCNDWTVVVRPPGEQPAGNRPDGS